MVLIPTPEQRQREEQPTAAATAAVGVAVGAAVAAAAIGGSGDASVAFVAREDIPAFACVTPDGRVADSSSYSGCARTIGVSLAAVPSGFPGAARQSGAVDNPDWNWQVPSLVYLNGASLSATPPQSGWCRSVGVAVAPTRLVVQLGPPVLL